MPSAQEMMQALIARGLSPVQAAGIAGHMAEESGFNTRAYNPGEEAVGLIQWRGPRREHLSRFAAERGKDVSDLDTQLDFILEEMRGTESKAGKDFFAGQDLPSVHAALKRYIRYGSPTDDKRFAAASSLLGGAPVAGVPSSPSTTAPAPFSLAGPQVAASGDGGMKNILSTIARNTAEEDDQMLEPLSIAPARPMGWRNAQKLLAMMKRVGA